MNKCLVLFVEGATEIEFYKRLINYERNKRKVEFTSYIEYENVKGVGGFQRIAIRKFTNDIKPKYFSKYGKKFKFCIALCRDTDVFEFTSHPPVNWKEVECDFRDEGANKVIHIEASHSIEDWFLYDIDGILSFLHLPKETKVTGKNGIDKMEKLYRKASRVYNKGSKTGTLISQLNIEKIGEEVCETLNPLYKEIF